MEYVIIETHTKTGALYRFVGLKNDRTLRSMRTIEFLAGVARIEKAIVISIGGKMELKMFGLWR